MSVRRPSKYLPFAKMSGTLDSSTSNLHSQKPEPQYQSPANELTVFKDDSITPVARPKTIPTRALKKTPKAMGPSPPKTISIRDLKKTPKAMGPSTPPQQRNVASAKRPGVQSARMPQASPRSMGRDRKGSRSVKGAKVSSQLTPSMHKSQQRITSVIIAGYPRKASPQIHRTNRISLPSYSH